MFIFAIIMFLTAFLFIFCLIKMIIIAIINFIRNDLLTIKKDNFYICDRYKVYKKIFCIKNTNKVILYNLIIIKEIFKILIKIN